MPRARWRGLLYVQSFGGPVTLAQLQFVQIRLTTDGGRHYTSVVSLVQAYRVSILQFSALRYAVTCQCLRDNPLREDGAGAG